MHGEITATYCPGKHHFSCPRIPCRRQGRRYRLHNYVIPDEVLSSLPRILLRVSRHGHMSHQLDPSSQLSAWKASLWRRTRDQLSSLGMFLVSCLCQKRSCGGLSMLFAHLPPMPWRIFKNQWVFCHRDWTIIYHTLLAVCSYKRAQALSALLAY